MAFQCLTKTVLMERSHDQLDPIKKSKVWVLVYVWKKFCQMCPHPSKIWPFTTYVLYV